MRRIGIDVGSTYTKYCVMNEGVVESLYMEKTPVHQQAYFQNKIKDFHKTYGDIEIVSCGYGKNNVDGISKVNELAALAKGSYHVMGQAGMILDVGGQDTKLILQEEGKLKSFFLNDKCAAGSGMFLVNTLNMLEMEYKDLDFSNRDGEVLSLTSSCAVFAQGEIVELVAANENPRDIVYAVICQIYKQAKPLLTKMRVDSLYLSGGLSQIHGIEKVVENVLGVKTNKIENGQYLAAIGCAIYD